MKILSIDKQSEIIFKMEEDEHGCKFYSIGVRIGLGHSEFKGLNDDISFLNLQEFVEALDQFILDRDIGPKLNCTYGSYLLFKGTTSYVTIEFNIGGAYCGRETYNYSVRGTIGIDQESLTRIVDEFRSYASG